MIAPSLLVTGFGPFPTMPRNPSEVLARRLTSHAMFRLGHIDVRCAVLTTAYGTLEAELAAALAGRPDAVLMIGVAGRSKVVRVEWRATNRRSILFPDAEGARATRPERPHSRSALRTPVPAAKALRVLRRGGVPARLSRDAGRYLCNAAYYHAIQSGVPALFIHIPRRRETSRPSPRRRARLTSDAGLETALAEIGRLLVREARALARR